MHALTDEAERLLTLRESYQLTGSPASRPGGGRRRARRPDTHLPFPGLILYSFVTVRVADLPPHGSYFCALSLRSQVVALSGKRQRLVT